MKYATRFVLCFAVLASTGCATDKFSNRLACGASKSTAFVVSQYGAFGIASGIDAADAAVICPAVGSK